MTHLNFTDLIKLARMSTRNNCENSNKLPKTDLATNLY